MERHRRRYTHPLLIIYGRLSQAACQHQGGKRRQRARQCLAPVCYAEERDTVWAFHKRGGFLTMALYVDSAFLPDVERVCGKLTLVGATTNPSILLAASQRGQRMSDTEVLRALLEVCPGSIFIQPVGETLSEMQRLAEGYVQVAPARVVAKLPLTPLGMQVARALRSAGARYAFTCVFTVMQAYSGAVAGAEYVIPYFGRLRRSGQDACERIEGMARLLHAQATKTRVLA